MGLNIGNLGFTFAAEGKGFLRFQKDAIRGFGSMSSKIEEAAEATRPLAASFNSAAVAARRAQLAVAGFSSAGMAEDLRRANTEVERAAEVLSHDLPVAAEAGARSFHKEGTRVKVDSEALVRSLGKVGAAASAMKDTLGKAFKGAGQAVSSQMKSIGSGVSRLLTAQTNLSTGLEAEGIQLAKAARTTGAQIGYTGAELKKFTREAAGMAAALNIDASTAGKAIYQFKWAGKELAAVGIRSAKQVAKLQESGIVNTENLAKNMRRLREQFQFTDAGMGTFIGSLYELGKEAGDVPGAIDKAGQIIEVLGAVTDKTGKLMRGVELEKFAASTVAASRGFYAIYQDADKATEVATGLAKVIASNRDQYQHLFDGTAEGYPEMLLNLERLGVRAKDAFALMQEGPEGVMKGLALMTKDLRKSGKTPEEIGATLSAVRGWMGKAFGDPAIAEAIEDFSARVSKADDKTLDAMAAIKGATVDLGKLGDEAHTTGRTLDEEFSRIKEAGVMGFRAISRASAVAFVQATGKEFQRFNKKMAALGKEDGPLGDVVRKLSLMHQIGAYALIPETLRPMAVLFGEIGTQIGPLLGALTPIVGGLLPVLSDMGGPMALLSIASAALVVPLTALGLRFGQLLLEGKSVGQAFTQIGKDIQDFANGAVKQLGESVDWVYGKFTEVDWKAAFSGLFDALKSFASGDMDILGMLFGGGAGESKGRISEMAGKVKAMVFDLKDAFVAAVAEADWAAIGAGLLDKLIYVFVELPNKMIRKVLGFDWGGVAKAAVEGLAGAFAKSGEDAGGLGMRLFTGLAEMAPLGVRMIWTAITAAFDALGAIDWGKVGSDLWTGLKGAFKGAAKASEGLGTALWGWISGALAWVSSKWDAAGDWIMGAMDSLGEWAKKGLSWLWDQLPAWIGKAWGWVSSIDWAGMGAKLLKGVIGMLAGAQAWLTGLPATLLGWAVSGITWVLSKIPPAIAKYLPLALKFIDDLPKTIEGMLSGKAGAGAAGSFIGGLFSKFAAALDKYKPVLFMLFAKTIPLLIQSVVKLIAASAPLFVKLVPVLMDVFGKIWGYLMDTGRDFVIGVFEGIKDFFVKKFPELKGPIEAVFGAVKIGVTLVFGFFKKLWVSIFTGVAFVSRGAKAFIDLLVKGFAWVYEKAKLHFMAVRTLVQNVFASIRNVWAGIQETWSAAMEKVKAVITPWIDSLSKLWEGVKEKAKAVGEALMGPWEKVSSVMAGFRDSAKDFFAPFLAAATSFGKKLIAKFKGIVGGVADFLLGVYDKISGLLHVPGMDRVISKEQIEATTKSLKAVRDAAKETERAAEAVSKVVPEGLEGPGGRLAALERSFHPVAQTQQLQKNLGKYRASLEKALAETVPAPQREAHETYIRGIRGSIKETEGALRKVEEAEEAITRAWEVMRAANPATDVAKVGEAVAGAAKAVEAAVGHSIQWDWYDAMDVMSKASGKAVSGIGSLDAGVRSLAKTAAGLDDVMLFPEAGEQHDGAHGRAGGPAKPPRSAPMKDLMAAVDNPGWYSDWKPAFMQANEALRQEVRALGDKLGGGAAAARPGSTARRGQPESYLSRAGMTTGRTRSGI